MPTRFLLLATQRTGSTWVQEMLNSHPRVKVYTELFIAGSTGMPLWEPRDIEFVNTYWQRHARWPRRLTRQLLTIPYLQRVFAQPGYEAIGFKYMYDQILRSPLVLPYTALSKVHVVHLIRHNLLDMVISNQIAMKTGVFHVPTDNRPPIPWAPEPPREHKIEVDADEVIEQLSRLHRDRQRVRSWLRFTQSRYLELEYETLLQDPNSFGQIFDFLGLSSPSPRALHSGLRKIVTTPRSEVVENYCELERAITGTPFGIFLR
jgi:LPS sulfotransferase NodH